MYRNDINESSDKSCVAVYIYMVLQDQLSSQVIFQLVYVLTVLTACVCREIATLTYRGGDEWNTRFGRHKISESESPSLCPYFMIENYLDYQGESFIGKIDPNTLLYISKVKINKH